MVSSFRVCRSRHHHKPHMLAARPAGIRRLAGWPLLPANANATAPAGVSLRAVTLADGPAMDTLRRLFLAIFPNHAHYLPVLDAYAQPVSWRHPDTIDHVWLIERDGEPIGLRIFSYLLRRNVGHGAFVGLLPNVRGRGIGGWLVRQTLEQLGLDARRLGHPAPWGYSAEVERVEDGADEAERRERQRRLDFHRRCGAVLLPVDYTEPPGSLDDAFDPAALAGIGPKPMHLLFYPLDLPLTETMMRAIVSGLYADIYHLPAESWYVQRALQSLHERG